MLAPWAPTIEKLKLNFWGKNVVGALGSNIGANNFIVQLLAPRAPTWPPTFSLSF